MALFDDCGEMRKTNKAVLKNKLQILTEKRNVCLPQVVILDACAIFWTVPWPAAPAKVSNFVSAAVTTIMSRCASSTAVLQSCSIATMTEVQSHHAAHRIRKDSLVSSPYHNNHHFQNRRLFSMYLQTNNRLSS